MTRGTTTTVAFSLTRGGPLYRLLRRYRLVRGDGRDVARQSLALLAVGWLPLVVFGLLDDGTPKLTGDALPFHARYLLALPLMLLAEHLLEALCRGAIDSVANPDLGAAAPVQVAGCARAAERLRDSRIAEIVIALIVFGAHLWIWRATGRSALFTDYDPTGVSAIAALWHGLVSLPLFNFLLVRWLWRWLIWTRLMWQLSRLQLQLVPSHPDRTGGLGRLADSTFAIATLQAGQCIFLASSWGMEIARAHIPWSNYLVHLVIVVAAGEMLAILPMLPFTRALTRARFAGGDAYSRFALAYTRLFHARWIDRAERAELLGTPDVSGLADLVSSVQHVFQMRVTPFGRAHALVVLVSILAPMTPLPLIATGIPMRDLLERTVKLLVLGS